jgi:hypothetical protein
MSDAAIAIFAAAACDAPRPPRHHRAHPLPRLASPNAFFDRWGTAAPPPPHTHTLSLSLCLCLSACVRVRVGVFSLFSLPPLRSARLGSHLLRRAALGLQRELAHQRRAAQLGLGALGVQAQHLLLRRLPRTRLH